MRIEQSLNLTGLLVIFVLSIGCSSDSGTDGQQAGPGYAPHDHGPNGGHLVEIDENSSFRAEFLFEERTEKIVLELLDADEDRPRPIDCPAIAMTLEFGDQELEYELLPVPRDGETAGLSSRFEFDSRQFPQQVRAESEFTVRFEFIDNGQKIAGRLVHRNDHSHGFRHDE